MATDPIPAPAASASTPAATPMSTSSQSVAPAKRSHTLRNIVLGCGCLVIICCLVLCGSLFFAPGLISQAVASTTKGQDKTLTRIQQDEVRTIGDSVTQRLADQGANQPASATSYTVDLTEKEILALIMQGFGTSVKAQDVGINIQPGNMKLEIAASAILDASGTSTTTVNGQTSTDTTAQAFKDLFFTFDLGVGADGKSLVVKDFSTGSGFIDSVLPQSIKTQVSDDFSQGFTEATKGSNLTKIELKQGVISLTYGV